MAEPHSQTRAQHVPNKDMAGGSKNPNKAPKAVPPNSDTKPKPTSKPDK